MDKNKKEWVIILSFLVISINYGIAQSINVSKIFENKTEWRDFKINPCNVKIPKNSIDGDNFFINEDYLVLGSQYGFFYYKIVEEKFVDGIGNSPRCIPSNANFEKVWITKNKLLYTNLGCVIVKRIKNPYGMDSIVLPKYKLDDIKSIYILDSNRIYIPDPKNNLIFNIQKKKLDTLKFSRPYLLDRRILVSGNYIFWDEGEQIKEYKEVKTLTDISSIYAPVQIKLGEKFPDLKEKIRYYRMECIMGDYLFLSSKLSPERFGLLNFKTGGIKFFGLDKEEFNLKNINKELAYTDEDAGGAAPFFNLDFKYYAAGDFQRKLIFLFRRTKNDTIQIFKLAIPDQYFK